jgi:uncharacterized delta-60 repeat protein
MFTGPSFSRALAARPGRGATRIRSLPVAACAGLLGLFWAAQTGAVPGDSDMSFGGFGDGGKEVIGSHCVDMVLQADQKIVLLMFSNRLLLKRLLPDGSPDPSFGGDGQVDHTDPLFTTAAFASVAIQPDGKILVGGYTYPSPQDFLIVRLTASGSLDTTFGGDGIVTIDFDGDHDRISKVLVQPDGNIVAGGYAAIDGDFDFAVARLFPNGSLDTDFGGDGQATVPFGGSDIAVDMALQTNGKIVLAGWTSGQIDTDWAVARLNFNGTRDNGWGGDGKVTVGWGDLNDHVDAVAIAPDGKIVVTGQVGTSEDGRIARFTSTGALDSSFDGDGKVYNSEASCTDVAVQPNGKIVTLGWHESPGGDQKFGLHRWNANGALDTSFEGDGAAYIDFGADDRGHSIVIQADGRILAAGTTESNGFRTALARLWPDGQLDAGGMQAAALDNLAFPAASHEYTYGLVAQTDGRLLVAATVMNSAETSGDFALTRLLPNGGLDTAYGVAGQATLDLQSIDVARAIALQPDGKSVVGGYTGTTNPQFLVARFGTDGVLDASFGSGGSSTVDFAGGADFGHAIAVAPDGKIVLAGTVSNGSTYVFGVARFNTDGTMDTSFDADGKLLYNLGLPNQWASAVVVQPDGKIVVGGQANGDFALVRFLTTGAIDTSFGVTGAGIVITDMGGQDAIRALALDESGRIFAAGNGRASADFAIAQFLSNGQLATCGLRCTVGWPTGEVFADWGGSETAWSIDVRDGRVVAAGCADGRLAWAQFQSGSALDPVLRTMDLPGTVDCESSGEALTKGGAGVQFLFSDKVVIATTAAFDGDRNVVLAGFETTAATTSGSGEEEEVENAISARLYPAYPNPLLRESRFAFDLPRGQAACVRIYDVSGRLVRTLVQGDFGGGRHQATWDATDDRGNSVAAGVYYVRLDAGASRVQRSVVVLR